MKIAILGYGIEGESVYRYYRQKYPDAVITAYDNNNQPKNPPPADVAFVGGVRDFKNITADIAVRTPAIPPMDIAVTGELTTATREFMNHCPVPVIGVTGTKGKGTTASLIKSIIDASGKQAWLVGNIGISGLDILSQIEPDDIVVYEMSSFQLWDLDVSPHVSVVLGIEPEHLDVHKSMEDYVGAKANIARYQKSDDIVIYKAGNLYSKEISRLSSAIRVPYPNEETVHTRQGYFYYGEQELCSVVSLRLPGQHNIDNACAAIAAVWPWVKDKDVIESGIEAFQGLPHRLKYVKTVNGVSYYDDSIATTPGSAIAALTAFRQPKVIILGGSYKGANYDELAFKIAETNVRYVILIGSEAPKIEAALEKADVEQYINLGLEVTMDDVVRLAASHANPKDVVILSPACASFDMFVSYNDRGEQFIQAVEHL